MAADGRAPLGRGVGASKGKALRKLTSRTFTGSAPRWLAMCSISCATQYDASFSGYMLWALTWSLECLLSFLAAIY